VARSLAGVMFFSWLRAPHSLATNNRPPALSSSLASAAKLARLQPRRSRSATERRPPSRLGRISPASRPPVSHWPARPLCKRAARSPASSPFPGQRHRKWRAPSSSVGLVVLFCALWSGWARANPVCLLLAGQGELGRQSGTKSRPREWGAKRQRPFSVGPRQTKRWPPEEEQGQKGAKRGHNFTCKRGRRAGIKSFASVGPFLGPHSSYLWGGQQTLSLVGCCKLSAGRASICCFGQCFARSKPPHTLQAAHSVTGWLARQSSLGAPAFCTLIGPDLVSPSPTLAKRPQNQQRDQRTAHAQMERPTRVFTPALCVCQREGRLGLAIMIVRSFVLRRQSTRAQRQLGCSLGAKLLVGPPVGSN